MNTKHVDAIAKAVLYEGYMLYPYRPSSVKNRQRFNFGVLYPRSYAEEQSGADRWDIRTECLIEGSADSTVEIKARFLKLIERSVAKFAEPEVDPEQAPGPHFVHVERAWQEAAECDVTRPPLSLQSLTSKRCEFAFEFPSKEETEPLNNDQGETVGIITRKQKAICGTVEIAATAVRPGLFKLHVSLKNQTLLDNSRETISEVVRDQVLMHSLVSAHVLLGVNDGKFVSLLEPPDDYQQEVAACRNQNEGVWPVLVGEQDQRDTMLASPIILYDYPQIAPESPGDLFDGCEIDEILALRIMTMTDEEKREVRASDDRARKMLDRTEALPMEHLARLHGILRDLRPVVDEKAAS